MAGSSVLASWFAHAAFWAPLACGWWLGELRLRTTVILLTLWLLGSVGLLYFPHGAAMIAPFVAVLDIVLVLTVYKADVRLS